MPELPEIETIRVDLEQALQGDQVVGLEVFDRRLMSAQIEKEWTEKIVGQPWVRIGRHGKYLLIDLKNGYRLMFHMRMTGQMLLKNGSSPAAREKADRMQLDFKSGIRLILSDQRRFAEARLLKPGTRWHSDNFPGPDALTELDLGKFEQLVKRTTRIQPLLMDQKLLAGVGNIYAQEALFKAAIRPTRPGNRLSKAEVTRLFNALQETLQTAIDYRGSTSRNYRDAKGQQGTAQTLHAVYRKGATPCSRCRTPLRSARVGGRGTVFCPQCQK